MSYSFESSPPELITSDEAENEVKDFFFIPAKKIKTLIFLLFGMNGSLMSCAALVVCSWEVTGIKGLVVREFVVLVV